MRQHNHSLTIETDCRGLHEFTREVTGWVVQTGVSEGLLTLFVRHTSASLLVQENAAPAARRDLERFFGQIAPEDDGYEHDDEGPDDMPAHIRSALTATSLSIPVFDAQPVLGAWQGIYLFEHRRSAHRRQIALHLIGA
ncbi:secondary thiamine-phosphate synthase enzyme YjbQ [Stakelama sp. CBK3Z-3]|uniref:Secondary thiamine-phosphate synthase enzyme YjbQ n=1 Tax=Stakelama flava TaxID=2860338 RepID=A0ABS6XRK3_9SPHN|nr:secondary thiamine-phosphate synthase enzyme YjbQ [Stakelama flava]MBW4332040.1 secondary thiamine-phosphate synthase enzyme YjbQ [Stakelama flava]